jgi:divalent metal cation (Fe/Co/Zn/Cd) transporter
LKEIRQEAKEVEGVLDVHRIRARQLGKMVALDMHVDVDPEISVIKAHKIAHSVQKRLEELEEVESVLVHVCPYGVKIGKED